MLVASGTPAYSSGTRTFTYSGATLVANKRYRAMIELSGTALPAARILMPQAHHFEWTFNTWTGPQGTFASSLPTPRTDGVSFPTQLPPWPHLRFLYNGPVSRGLGDTDAVPFVVKDYLGNQVYGAATWIDQDMTRLHLMVYNTLAEGKRYDVFCTSGFASATGLCNTSTPIARFSTQVTPPQAAAPILVGKRFDQDPSKAWLAARPTVINQPYGLKERWAKDASGPTTFEGHNMLVPAAPSDVVANITIDPNASGGCRALAVQPDSHCDGTNLFVTAPSSCTSDSQCQTGFRCIACPGQGNPACPDEQNRCHWDAQSYESELLQFCRDIIAPVGQTALKSACTLQDAYRCVTGGNYECDSNKNRMNAVTESACPATYKLDPVNNCVPAGRMAIDMVSGDHHATTLISSEGGRSWSAGSFLLQPAPVVVQTKAGSSTPATYLAAESIPSSGLVLGALSVLVKSTNPPSPPPPRSSFRHW